MHSQILEATYPESSHGPQIRQSNSYQLIPIAKRMFIGICIH